MDSLANVYEEGAGSGTPQRHLRAGIGLLIAGAILAMLAIIIGGTSVGGDPMEFSTREIAGMLGGLAAPLFLGGVMMVLPAAVQVRIAAAVGASITVLGVAMFSYAYPNDWGVGDNLTATVAIVYLLGLGLMLGAMFLTVVRRRRLAPQGMEALNATTNTRSETTTESTANRRSTEQSSAPTSDGGTDTNDIEEIRPQADRPRLDTSTGALRPRESTNKSNSRQRDDGDDGWSRAWPSEGRERPEDRSQDRKSTDGGTKTADSTDGSAPLADRYCGNCQHITYGDEGVQPFCDYHDERLDTMDPCPDWDPTHD